MLKTIIGTTFTKILTAIIGFIIVVLNTRHLGATGQGTISLIILAITIIMIVNEIISGGAIVYLTPRYPVFSIIGPAYLWTFINIVVFSLILRFFQLVPKEYYLHVLSLSAILCLSSLHSNILVGKARIGYYNVASILQSLSVVISLYIFFFVRHQVNILSYLYSLYISYSVAFLLGFSGLIKYFGCLSFREFFKAVPEMFRFGFFAQVANIAQILNYRLCYYLIDNFLGRASLGKFSVGVQVSESTWLIGRSIATIHYSNVSNSNDKDMSRISTILFVKFIFVLTALLIAFILLIPNSLFEFVFGKDFSGIPWIIFSLGFGIVTLSVNMMFSSFFSGIGKIHYNTAGSVIGLIVTLSLAFLIIPKFGVVGAALVNSISYCSIAVYSFITFMIITGTRINEFAINRNDFRKIINAVRKLFLPVGMN
jgi:O-antigen/teichoic acid export membrane protein